jgi:hypothetical protein
MLRLCSAQVLDFRSFGFAQDMFWILDWGGGRIEKYCTHCFRFLSGNRKSKIQNQKWVGIVAIGVTFTMCGAVAQAQQPRKIPRLAILEPGFPSKTCTVAFRQGLRELGYVDGQHIVSNLATASRSLGGSAKTLPH